MKKLLIFLVCFMCLFVTGCQKKEVVTDIEDVSGDLNVESGDVNTESSENNEISNDYFFPNSSTEKIQKSELAKLSVEELDIAKNEIFARHGHDFSSKTLREYFESKKWYKAIPGKKVAVSELNQIEQSNVALIDKEISYRKDSKIIGEHIKVIDEIVSFQIIESIINQYSGDFETEVNKYPLNSKVLCCAKEYAEKYRMNKLDVYFCGYTYEDILNPVFEIVINNKTMKILNLCSIKVIDLNEEDDFYELAMQEVGELGTGHITIYRFINNQINILGCFNGYSPEIENFVKYQGKYFNENDVLYFREETLIPKYYDENFELQFIKYSEVKGKIYTVTEDIIKEVPGLCIGDKVKILERC